MNDINQILLEGRLVRDPNAKRLESGAVVCTFSVASNSYYYDKANAQRVEKTLFMLIETWGNVAESCIKYLTKGSGVRVAGSLKQSRWDGEHGVKMKRTVILADHVEFAPRAVRSEPEPEHVPAPVKAAEAEPSAEDQQVIDETIIKEETTKEEAEE